MKKIFSPNLSLGKDLAAAIGDIVARWSFMEWQLSRVLHELLSLDPKRGRIVTTRMNSDQVIVMVYLLLELNGIAEPIVLAFKETTKEIERLRGERNNIVHGLWATRGDEEGHYLVWYTGGKNKNRVTGKSRPMAARDVRAVAAQIDLVSARVDWIHLGIQLGELPPWGPEAK